MGRRHDYLRDQIRNEIDAMNAGLRVETVYVVLRPKKRAKSNRERMARHEAAYRRYAERRLPLGGFGDIRDYSVPVIAHGLSYNDRREAAKWVRSLGPWTRLTLYEQSLPCYRDEIEQQKRHRKSKLF